MNRGKIKGSNISGEEVSNQKQSHCSRKQRSLRCLSLSFSIVAHKVCLLVSAIFNPNLHRKSVSVRADDLRPPVRKICIRLHNYCICRCLHGTNTKFLEVFCVMYCTYVLTYSILPQTGKQTSYTANGMSYSS